VYRVSALSWPFVGAEALATGVIIERVMRRRYEPIYPGIHVPCGGIVSAGERAQAAWLWSKRRGIVAGLSAAAMHGCNWIDSSDCRTKSFDWVTSH
jgi:hypothetical protein